MQMEGTGITNTKSTKNTKLVWRCRNLSTVALHKMIVGNKFQPPSNENKITRLGAARPDVPEIYITKDTKLIMFQFNINRYMIYTKDKLRRANLILMISATSAKQKSMQINTFFSQCFHGGTITPEKVLI